MIMSLNDFAIKFAAASALMFLIAGCSVGPNYQKPDTAVPGTWNEAPQSGIDTRSSPLSKWWTEFNDPLLNALVERAVQSNLDIRLAEARIRESRALRAVTASDLWPGLETSGSYRRSRSSENAFVSGEGGDAAMAQAISSGPVSTPAGKSTCLAACAEASKQPTPTSPRRSKSGATRW
jgi:outer membrane protein TolC